MTEKTSLPPMRKHWWQFWRPTYIWVQQQGPTVLTSEATVNVPQTGPVKTKPKQFIPDEHRTGGRIVKTMPAQLRHMKEIADKTDD